MGRCSESPGNAGGSGLGNEDAGRPKEQSFGEEPNQSQVRSGGEGRRAPDSGALRVELGSQQGTVAGGRPARLRHGIDAYLDASG